MSNFDRFEVTLKQALPLINVTLKAGLVPFLKSAPGIGKSSMALQIAQKNNLQFMGRYVATYDPTDFNGLPFKTENERTGFLAPAHFPLEGKDELGINPDLVQKASEENPELYDEYCAFVESGDTVIPASLNSLKYKGYLILLDEVTSAPDSVQVAAYRFLLEREVGDNKLHPKAFVMAAGNGIEHGAIASEMGTAMKSRVVTYNIKASHKAFIEWAEQNSIDSRIINFVATKPETVNDFDPSVSYDAFSCSRTMHFLSRQLKFIDNPANSKYLPLYAGTIGPEHATNFYNFMKIYGQVASFDEILKDAANIALPSEPQVQMVMADIAQAGLTEDNIGQLVPFFDRLVPEFRVVALRRAALRDKTLASTPEFDAFSTEIAKLLM